MAKDIVSVNDEKVLALKKLVDEKKEKLAGRKATRYKSVTTCTLDLDGTRHNFNVLNKKQLNGILVRLHALVLAAEDLEIEIDVVELSGFPLSHWITDLKGKINEVAIREEEAELRKAEAALDKLLSQGKKVELELNNLEALLKG
ncbi:hypothetical protein HOBO_237 [Bacillus phage Hobo]|uniref:Uncharacterized protein n=2 Tax=Caeruleovirus BM15 TaxID=1985178 RepID=A0A0S2MUW4_9CAUD|nr:hypothetical protein FD732_gp104 [Bacillus phage BM15]ALO79645.1 hypothetical protein BM10_241 [Bacillus phage BM15]AXQ66992.1 hypothetical protein HOBO_237 [Bacillus phage Hobo]